MNWKSISEIIIDPISGEWGEEGDRIKVLRTTNFSNDGRLNLSDVVKRNVDLKKIEKKKLKVGDSIIEKSGGSPSQPVGRVVYFDVDNEDFICNNFTSVLRLKNNDFDSRYFFWNLYYQHLAKNTLKFQNKTTGIINLQLQRYLTETKIKHASLQTQKHIASILDKADALRQQNRQLLNYYDELLQSTFIEMFGDPVKNTKGWETKLFGHIGKLDRGVSKHRPRNASALLGGPYPLIQTGDVANSNGYISSYKSTYSELGLRQSRLWNKGTLCITIAANIAKTGILTFDACFPDSVVGFVPDEKLSNNEYVQCWLSFLQKILEDSAPESAQKNINLEILRNLRIPIPPLILQKRFANTVHIIENHKEEVRITISEMDTLFGGLLTKFFNNI